MPAARPAASHPPARQRGVAAVEFAVLVFVLLLIGAGLVEFGRTLWYYNALAKGTRDAARYLSTVPAGTLASQTATARNIVVQAATAALVPGFSSANVSAVCMPTACASVVQPSDVTQVTVSASFPLSVGALFPFVTSGGDGYTFAPGASGNALTLAPHTAMPYMW